MTKKADPLALAAERLEQTNCKHPHLVFTRNGFQLNCVDCDRRYVAALDDSGVQYDIGDFSYMQPAIADGSPRHSPDEAPRIAKKPKIAEKTKKIR